MTTHEQLIKGFQHQSHGEFAKAKAIYEEVLKVEPNNKDALYLIGMLALQTENEQPGTQYLIHAVNNGCTQPDLYINLAKVLRKQNNNTDAYKVLLRGTELLPNNLNILISMGVFLRQASYFDRAIKTLRHALEVDENSSEANLEIAITYQAIDNYEQAEEHFKKAAALTPNVTTFNHYGFFLAQVKREEEAIKQFRKALEFDPASEMTLNNLGFHLYTLGKIDESIDTFNRCLSINPNNAEAHGLYAFPLLLKGEYEKGWNEYEWRFKTPTFPPSALKLGSPVWKNEPLDGKTILLLSEQGYGDTFQFVRYANQLTVMGAKVMIVAYAPAIELLKNVPGVSQVVAFSDNDIPAHDYHIYMMSLPQRLKTTLETIPQNAPYLFADTKLTAKWKNYFASYDRFKVGIVWAGNPDQRNNLKRSCPLEALAPLFELHDVQVFSLAKDRPKDEGPLPNSMIDLGDQLNSFSDTAAIIDNLDLVITVCTSMAHLAGALGRPVWVLLAASADWRWLIGREDSPWYPTARLLRQNALHDWDGLLQNVAADLHPEKRQKLLT